MRAKLALGLLAVLALSLPASTPAKGFTRVALVASDGRSVELRTKESEIDGLLSRRGTVVPLRGGYLRLFFLGPGDFPANPARYYPDPQCVALDWPTYERSCRRVSSTLIRLLRRARTLSRFRIRPTVLARVTYLGSFSGHLKTAAALKSPVELALDRTGRTAPQPRRCYPFTGRWRGPIAALRPRRFLLCADGIYADHRFYPLGRGVWEWFQRNVGPIEASDAWAKLRRPLHLPTLASGAGCPVSGLARLNFAKYGVGKGIGPGPAYPIGFGQPGSLLRFTLPPDSHSEFAGSAWSGQKVLWFVAPSYRGPVLIRGGRLDGPETLRFERGRVPPTELGIRAGARGGYPPGYKLVGQRYRPSYTRLRAQGCYAYQIDGMTFSRVIVFRAVAVPTA